MNQELHALFEADQAERKDHPAYDTPEYWQLRLAHFRRNTLNEERLRIV